MSKILIVSDAWKPQVNGVVRSLEMTARELTGMGHDVQIVGPDASRRSTVALPSYPEIKIEFLARPRLKKILKEFAPDYIHIATEGPLGWSMRGLCLAYGLPFSTSYHTSFPEYVGKRVPAIMAAQAERLAYAVVRRFHAPSAAVMVATPTVEAELTAHKFHRLVRWGRGVDTDLYQPYGKDYPAYENLPRPILVNVGRVSVEKNLPAFLDLKTSGSLVVVGDGPALAGLRTRYPRAHFLGAKSGEDLARAYAAADLFVFPSKTDTFGLVLLEAAAAGLRVAAYPVVGPRDVLADDACKKFSALHDNLQTAVDQALALPDDPQSARRFALRHSWRAATEQFYRNLQAPSPRAISRVNRWRRKIGLGL